MEHGFDVEVAKIVGVNAAILFKNISHWCEKNKANDKNMFDGEYWTYNSIKAFEELFPYMSVKQIKYALDKLKEFGFIGFGEYNQNPYDRTRWYCDLTQKVGLKVFLSSMPKRKMEKAKRENVDDTKRASSITDINTDSKPNIKHLNINDDLKKSSDKKEAHKSFKPIVKYFCEEYWPTYDFKGPRDGKQINEIIKQIEKLFEKNGREVTPDSVTEFFKMVIQNLPKFYQFKNLTKINSGFSEIIEEIKNSKNGQQKPLTRNQQVGEESRAFQERIRARAARNNS